MPVVAALPAIIGAAGSIGGAAIAGSAAKGAGEIQQNAAIEAARAALQTGEGAATGVERATQDAVGGVLDRADLAARTITGAKEEGQQGIQQATEAAISAQQPFQAAGTGALTTLGDLINSGALNKEFAFNPADLENEPGYQFQLQQGQKALERSAAARGSLASGGTLKSLANFSQGLASTTFGDAYNRALKTFQTNREGTQAQVGALQNLVGTGATAATNAGQFGQRGSESIADLLLRGNTAASEALMQGSQLAGQFGIRGAESAGNFRQVGTGQAGDWLTGGAAAKAAGNVGAANAWTGSLGDLVKIGQDLPWGTWFPQQPQQPKP